MTDPLAGLHDPIVIDPPGFDPAPLWAFHNEQLKQITDDNGTVNWRAAMNADPGVCHCPNCKTAYWKLGKWQRCQHCGMEFPTDAWAMYSWGVQAYWRSQKWQVFFPSHESCLRHPYYAYGFEHPVFNGDTWKYYRRIPWADVFGLKSWSESVHGKGSEP